MVSAIAEGLLPMLFFLAVVSVPPVLMATTRSWSSPGCLLWMAGAALVVWWTVQSISLADATDGSGNPWSLWTWGPAAVAAVLSILVILRGRRRAQR